MDIFNNRELASFIWITLVAILVVCKSVDVRKSILAVLKSLFSFKIIFPFIIMVIYLAGITVLLKKAGYWNMNMLKDSIMWYFIAACPLAMVTVASSENDTFFFKDIVLKSFSFAIFFEYIVNFYSFPLLVEIIMVPLITFVFVGGTISSGNEEPKSKVSQTILCLIGLTIIGYAIYRICGNYKTLVKWVTLKNFLLSPIYTVCLYPFIYLLALASAYESLFIRLELGCDKKKSLKLYAKWKLLLFGNLNIKKVKQAMNMGIFNIMSIRDKKEVDEMIAIHRNYKSPCFESQEEKQDLST